MRRIIRRRLGTGLVAGAILAGGLAVPAALGAVPGSSHHVLLLSVDGLHDFDLNLWVAQHPQSNLAGLVKQGTTYSQASTSIPSDSFPGLLAMLTGGTPKSTGVFYDASYDRSLYPPGSACLGPQGTEALYDETVANRDAAGHIPFSGGAVDPARLPLRKVDDRCDPVQPRDFLKVNTIFGVAHAASLHTAWSDKHPAYQIVEGPGTAKTVDDLFTPEINADVTPANFPRPDLAITDWVPNTITYDGIKVAAVRNQIDGLDSSGHSKVGVPAIFGMNFQAVSVGEKLVDPIKSCVRNTKGGCDPNYVAGGYMRTKTGALTFTPQMALALAAVDKQVGGFADELKKKGLWSSTELILSAKHGQSPIDPTTLVRVPETNLQAAAAADNDSDDGLAFDIADDSGLLWLKPGANVGDAAASLRQNAASINLGSGTVLFGPALAALYGQNERTPDIIVQPQPGTLYSTSVKKVAEHGGGAADDTHVALVVAGGGAAHVTVSTPVQTRQIAPSILTFLGLNPGALQAVALEGTTPLPTK
jgi:hypothetical protein